VNSGFRAFFRNLAENGFSNGFYYASSFSVDNHPILAVFSGKSVKTQRIILIIRAASLSVPFLPQPHLRLPAE
jgi:hypothetical protein